MTNYLFFLTYYLMKQEKVTQNLIQLEKKKKEKLFSYGIMQICLYLLYK